MKQKTNDIKKITKEKKSKMLAVLVLSYASNTPISPPVKRKEENNHLSLHCGGRHIVIDPLIAFRSWRRCTVL